MADQKFNETYQVIEETKDRNQKEKYWSIGFGLNKIDQLNPSEYLTNTLLPDHFSGKLTYHEVGNALVELYFRNTLVRANYSNQVKNISHTDIYLVKFFEKLLFNREHPLLNQEMQLIQEDKKENDWEPVV